MLKKKGGPGADEASTSGKQSNQDSVAEETVEEPCDVLSVNLDRGKGRFSNVWLLDSGCIYHIYPKKKWFSTYVPFEGVTILMRMMLRARQLEYAVSARRCLTGRCEHSRT